MKIAVATDFSVRSDRALLRATLMARRTGAGLVLIHVVDEDQPPELIASAQRAASALLDATVRALQEQGIAAEPLVTVADVAGGILDAAAGSACELVVLGPHRSRALDVFTGTTVQRVLRISRMPVLVAVDTPARAHTRTLIALDFDEPSRAAGIAALELGVFDHTDVTLLHVFDASAEGALERRAMSDPGAIQDYRAFEQQQATEKLHALVDDIGLAGATMRLVPLTNTLARTILESAKQDLADLVVIGTSQRTGFERLLIGSVTSDIIQDAHRDILIVPVP